MTEGSFWVKPKSTLKVKSQNRPFYNSGQLRVVRALRVLFGYAHCNTCKHRIVSEQFNSAFLQLGEEEPLFYTNTFCSPLKDIEDWMTKRSDRHLIVTSNLALGFEHNIVINLSGVSSSSRSSGHLIIPSPVPRFPNLMYQTLPVRDYSQQIDHDCRYLFMAGLDTPLDVISMNT